MIHDFILSQLLNYWQMLDRMILFCHRKIKRLLNYKKI